MSRNTLGRRGVLSGGLAVVLTAAPGTSGGEGTAHAALVQPDEDVAEADACDPLFLAAFRDWLRTESGRFALPASVDTASSLEVQLKVAGVHPVIHIPLSDYTEINVSVVWEEEHWDALLWLDAHEEPGPGGVGWVSGDLPPEYQVVHPTLEAIWRAEVFEPLLTWINEDLAHATHLAMWEVPNRATWARLVRDGRVVRRGWTLEENGGTPAHLLPVHGHPV